MHKSKISKRRISVENLEEMKTKVESYCAFLENIQEEKGSILQSRTKTGFLGLIICLKNLITLAESLFATKKIKFLMTYSHKIILKYFLALLDVVEDLIIIYLASNLRLHTKN